MTTITILKLLNFVDQTRSGVFTMIRPLAIAILMERFAPKTLLNL